MTPARLRQSVVLATFLSLSLAACADKPTVLPPATAKSADSYASRASFAAPEIAWPDQHWWTRYGDPQLDQLIDEAMAGSPDLRVAQARLRAAQASATVAGAAQLPSLSANASVTETKQSYNDGFPAAFVPKGYLDAESVTLNASYSLDLWGKNRAAASAALSDEEAARLDAAMVGITLSSAVADAYADLARLYAERDVAETALEIRQQTLDLTAKRLKSGLDTRAEYKQAESGVPAARASLMALDEQIQLGRNRIAALLGAGPDRGLAITRPPAATLKPFGLPASLPVNLIGRRADIAAARARAEAAGRRLDVADAAFYPDIDLVGFVGSQVLGINFLTKSGSDVGGIGPAISLPIFTGHQLQGQYRRAEADYDAAVASYDQAVNSALHEVADVTSSEKALSGQIDAARQAVADADEAYQLARRRYEGGLANFLSVLVAEDNLLANRRTLSDLESRAFSLDIALFRALGGGFGVPL